MLDVNDEKPRIEYYINRVGVSKVYIPFYSILNNNKVNSIAEISAYIDLPKSHRGIHASRIMESIVESILMYKEKTYKIEDLCGKIANKLLDKHKYAFKAIVNARGTLVYETVTPVTSKKSVERVGVYGKAIAKKVAGKNIIRKYVGIKIAGMTACPSAQRTISKNVVGNIEYVPTHIQRGYARLLIEVPPERSIEIMDLINIVRESVSTPTYHLLKKEDEARIILNSLKRPRLTEDVVREIAWSVVNKYKDYPGSCEIMVEYKSIESIHDHNLVARIYSTFNELRYKGRS
jgi:GTP cyclohydrolase-4